MEECLGLLVAITEGLNFPNRKLYLVVGIGLNVSNMSRLRMEASFRLILWSRVENALLSIVVTSIAILGQEETMRVIFLFGSSVIKRSGFSKSM